jgi:hypothetical protein
VSISAASFFSQTSFLDVLASAASNAAQMQSKIELDLINAQIQKHLAAQTAALQNTPDAPVIDALQQQLATLQKQASAATSIGAQFGGNVDTLADLQDQLGAMQTAAAGGDTNGFDAAHAAADIDVSNLAVIAPTAPYQPDRIDTLKLTGLSIGAAASYDLSSPSGQATAASDIQNTQDLINQIVQATTSNQVVAGSIATALNTQVSGLTATLDNLQQTGQLETTTKILQLTQQAQNQSHLIQLALGNSQALAQTLSAAANPPQPYSSPFDALQGSAGGVSSSGSTQTAPAVLSLLT